MGKCKEKKKFKVRKEYSTEREKKRKSTKKEIYREKKNIEKIYIHI